MKNIFKYSAVAVAAFALASCSDLNEYPVFQKDDAFVAFSKSSVSVSEAAGTVTITLSQAAVDPIRSVVAYEVLDKKTDTTGTYTAEKGVNFVDNSIDGLLFFENGERTASITFDIINPVDENGKTIFTGDLTFGIRILSASNRVDLGSENECVVTISDLDHPLASILGDYTASGESIYPGYEGTINWPVVFEKDAKDLKTVWITNIAGQYDSHLYPIYGTVVYDEDGENIVGITIPAGQTWAYSSYTMGLYEADGEWQGHYYPNANLKMVATANGFDLVPEKGGFLIGAKTASGMSIGDWFVGPIHLTR